MAIQNEVHMSKHLEYREWMWVFTYIAGESFIIPNLYSKT